MPFKRKNAAYIWLITFMIMMFVIPGIALANTKWQGTDDLVSQKMHNVAGISAKKPLFDTTQGNLGLFVFLAGGFAAGTVFGYQWRKIFGEKVGK